MRNTMQAKIAERLSAAWRQEQRMCRASVGYGRGSMLPRPTAYDAHILRTSLSPSRASLLARTLAWCFA